MSKNFKEFKKDYKYSKFENKVNNLFKSKYYKNDKFLFYANLFNAVFNIVLNSYYITGVIYLLATLLYFDSFRELIPFMRNGKDKNNKIIIIVVSTIAFVVLLTQVYLN